MHALDLVKLPALMERTSGRPDIVVGLLDGPVALNHPDLARESIREVPGSLASRCAHANSSDVTRFLRLGGCRSPAAASRSHGDDTPPSLSYRAVHAV